MDNQERNREALIEHIAEQDRIIRRRNEQIAAQVEIIDEVRRDLADYQAMHSQQIETIARLQKTALPLTADDITDEMIRRARTAWLEFARTDGTPTPEATREMLSAALTEPSTRPEGAEDIEALIREAEKVGQGADDEALADYLAARLTDPTAKEQS